MSRSDEPLMRQTVCRKNEEKFWQKIKCVRSVGYRIVLPERWLAGWLIYCIIISGSSRASASGAGKKRGRRRSLPLSCLDSRYYVFYSFSAPLEWATSIFTFCSIHIARAAGDGCRKRTSLCCASGARVLARKISFLTH